MASFTLNRVDKTHRGEKWIFETDGTFARLMHPDGQTVETFIPDQAFDAIEIVHFAKSGHNIGFKVGSETVHFAAWPKAFKTIKGFTELSKKSSDPEKIDDLRQSGLVRMIGGALFFIGGVIFSIDAFLKMSGLGGGGQTYLFWGAILIGAVFLYQSYYYYAEARRLQKLHE